VQQKKNSNTLWFDHLCRCRSFVPLSYWLSTASLSAIVM